MAAVVATGGPVWSPLQEAIFAEVAGGQGHLVVEACPGCLAGETMIGINRAGKGFTGNLEYVVRMFNGGLQGTRRWDPSIDTYVRAPSPDGTVRLAKVSVAMVSGMRETVIVDIDSPMGSLQATPDHRILTPNGWTPAGDLKPGSLVYLDDGTNGNGHRMGKRQYAERTGLQFHPYARGRRFKVASQRLQVEASINGLDLESLVWRCKVGEIAGLTFLDPAMVVHHKDQNHLNNSLPNLELMTAEEHRAEHFKDSITNIQTHLREVRVNGVSAASEVMTYDLTVPGVDAFIADGIAVHNSGKTTTGVEAFSRSTADRILFAAFGRETKATLESRLPGDIDVLTWHGYGMRACMRAWGSLNLKPYEINNRAGRLVGNGRHNKANRDFVAALVSAAKATLTDSAIDALDELADIWELQVPPKASRVALVGAASRLLGEDEADGPRNGVISYDDMCWMPIVHGLDTPIYDLVGVDETQDLNATQLELACKAAGAAGRIVAIGDRRQSIFGFRGADRQAIPRMIQRLSARTLPLNVCYRCGSSIVAEAAKIWPEVVARPGAHDGIVRSAEAQELRSKAQPGDFVVSRLNAPLISLCLQWLTDGRKARILGRDVGKGLLAQIQKIGASDVPGLLKAIDAWEDREANRLLDKDRDPAPIHEKAACIHALCEGLDLVAQVEARIESLFTDVTSDSAITLASTHKAKGLEADRVWLLRDTYCRRFVKVKDYGSGAPRAIHDPSSASEEERNLFYVAITRAKHELIYVKGIS